MTSAALLPVKRRYDLEIADTGTPGAPRWTVKDPLSLKYFHLRQHEYFVFCQLDGTVSAEDIEQRFHRRHAPERLSPEQVQRFILKLWQQGLLTLDRFGTAAGLWERSHAHEQQARTSWLMNILAIRFRGVDPDRFLTAGLPWVRWFFSPLCIVVAALLVLAAGSVAITECEQIQRELPRFSDLFSPNKIFWFALVIAVTKVLHELGHGFACKTFGGECRELGVMLLVFTPCLYCNVSDAWLLKRRWHRIVISAAGIYVELVLAALCTFLWLWTAPGMLHTLCLYVMVISSVNTVLLNGNPLLRYDGYYVLTDLVDVPNLRSRAQSQLSHWLQRVYFGVSIPIGPLRGVITRLLLSMYGVISTLYLWVVMLGILWMLYHAAQPHGAGAIVVAFGGLLIAARVWKSVQAVGGRLHLYSKSGELSVPRFVLCVCITLGAGWWLSGLSLTRYVSAPLVVVMADQRQITTTAAGVLSATDSRRYGTVTQAVEKIGEVINLDEQIELAELQSEVNRLTRKPEVLQIRQSTDLSQAVRISSVRSSLSDFQARLERRLAERARQRLVVDSGRLLVSPDMSSRTAGIHDQLQAQGGPLESWNRNQWVEVGTVLAESGDAVGREAVLYVDQTEVSLLQVGDVVSLIVAQTPGNRLSGTVTEIAGEPVESIPRALAVLQAIAFTPEGNGQLRPTSPRYEVRVNLEASTDKLVVNQPGNASIAIGTETVAQRLQRMLRRTFLFDLE